MTRDEFMEGITCVYDLLDFCNENRLESFTDDIGDEDWVSERVEECLSGWASYYTWSELSEILNDVPTCPGYYKYDGDYTFSEIDDDMFYDIKSDVCSYCVDHGYFDEDEIEDEIEAEIEAEIEDEIEDDEELEVPFSFDELIEMSSRNCPMSGNSRCDEVVRDTESTDSIEDDEENNDAPEEETPNIEDDDAEAVEATYWNEMMAFLGVV